MLTGAYVSHTGAYGAKSCFSSTDSKRALLEELSDLNKDLKVDTS